MLSKTSLTSTDKSRIYIAIFSLVLGTALLFFKFYAYEITGSEAILSDALESVVNVLGALISLITIIIAAKPADRDHPYGHGKAEYFSVAFEGGFISFAAVMIIYHAIQSLIRGHSVTDLDIGLAITVGAGIVNGALGIYLKRSGKKLKSQALKSGGEHLLSDFITSVAVVVGLLAVKFTGIVWIDPLVAIAFGLYLLKVGVGLFRSSLLDLMDTEDEEVLHKIGNLFTKHVFPGIIRIHRTRILKFGRYHSIDAHLVVPEFWEINKAHYETEVFEKKIMNDYGNEAEVRFHLDPCRRVYCEVCDLKNCPVRQKEFKKRIPFSLEELTNPEEPEEFR